MLLPHENRAALDASVLLTLLGLALKCTAKYSRLLAITYGAPLMTGPSCVAHSGCWALARALRLELHSSCIVSAGIQDCADKDTAMSDILAKVGGRALAATQEMELVWIEDVPCVPHLRYHDSISLRPSGTSGGTWLLTGGNCRLMNQAVGLICGDAASASKLVMTTCSGTMLAAAGTMRQGSQIAIALACDVAAASDTIATIQKLSLGTPFSILHSARAQHDAMLADMPATSMKCALGRKVVDAWLLHSCLGCYAVGAFVLITSIGVNAGAVGHANSAIATAYLDSLAHHRTVKMAAQASSVQLPSIAFWTAHAVHGMNEAVMTLKDEWTACLYASVHAGTGCMRLMTHRSAGPVGSAQSSPAKLAWSEGNLTESCAIHAETSRLPAVGACEIMSSEQVRALVTAILHEVAGANDVDEDTPLAEA
eukprot:4952070-Prymnesium_polylepis.1